MTKATETLVFFVILVSFWLSLYTGAIPVGQKAREEIVPVLPWWALVAFGSYALGTLGYDVLTFNDKPEKYKELMEQIEQAKVSLRQFGLAE